MQQCLNVRPQRSLRAGRNGPAPKLVVRSVSLEGFAMRKVVRVLLALTVAFSAAACGNSAGSPGGAFSPAGVAPAVAARNLHPRSPYEFWFYNDDSSGTLHVWNTYGGQCTLNQLPRTDLAPSGNWSGVLDTKDDEWCFFTSSSQD